VAFSNASNGTSTATVSVVGTYVLRWTISNGTCTASTADVTVNYYATPTTATITTSPLNYCGTLVSGSLGGNTPTNGTGTWTKVSGPGTIAFSNSNSGSSTATASVVGTYVLRWSITNGTCTASTADVTVNYYVTPTVSITGSSTICVGGTTTLSPTTGGTWTSSNTGLATVTNGGVVTAVAAGFPTFTFNETSTGCSNTTSALTIVADPTITTQPTVSQTVCVGATNPTLTVVASGGNGTFSYQWYSNTTNSTSGGTNLNSANGAQTATLTITTASASDLYYYCVITQSGSGCNTLTSNTGKVTVNPNPAITAMTTSVNSEAGFTVTPVNGVNGQVPAGTTYSWAAPSVTGGLTGGASGSGAASITGTLTNPTSVAQTATYTVTPTYSGCTGATFTVTVTVNPKPAITPMTLTVCSGTAFTVTPANGTNGIVPAGTTYSWGAPSGTGFTGGAAGSGAANISGTLTNTTQAPVTATYTVTPLSGSCTGPNFTVTITIDPTSLPGTVASDQSICTGSSPANLTLSGSTGTIQWQYSTDGTTNWTNLGTNSTTLTSAQMGTLTADRWYRTNVTSGICAAATSNSVKITVYPTSVAGTVADNQTICYDNLPANLTLSGNTGSIQWQLSTDNNTFTNISGATASPLTSAQMGHLTATTYYRAVVQSGPCASANSNVITITVDPVAQGGTVSGGTSPICLGSSTGTMTVNNIVGSVDKWQKQLDGGGWSDISGTVNSTYYSETPSSAGTWEYRPVVASGMCGVTTGSSVVTIIVNPTSVGGTASGNQTICNGSTPSNITLSGNTGSIQWQVSTNNSTFSDIVGATATPLTGIGSTETLYYRAMVTSGNCPPAYSNSVLVTVNTPPTAPTGISGTTTICNGGTTTLTATGGSVGSGCTYEWGTGSTVGSNIIVGATSISYTTPSLSSTTTYWVRRVGTSPCNTTTTGGVTQTVTVNTPPTAPTSITGTTSICSGSTTTLTASGGSAGSGCTYEWGTGSTVGSNIIAGATSASYTTPALSSTTTYWVRRVGTSPCNSVTTDGVTQTVTVSTPPTAPTTITGTANICSGGTTTLAANGGSEGSGCTYQWGTGTVGSNIIGGATSATYTTNALTSTTTFWVRRIGNSPCNSVTTSEATLTVIVDAVTEVGTAAANQTICSGVQPANITLSGSVGSIQWQVSTDNVSWANISGATSTPLTSAQMGALTQTRYYRALVTSGVCAANYSNTVTVTVVADPSINTQPASFTECEGGTLALSVVATGGTPSLTYQWYSNTSQSNSGGTSINGATSSNYTPASTSSGTYYYYCVVSASGSGCDNVTSNAVTVTVVPDITISVMPSSPANICVGGTSTNISLVATNGTPSLTYQWQYWTGGGWVNAVNGTPAGATYSGANTSDSFNVSQTVAGSYNYSCLVSASGNGCDAIQAGSVFVTVVEDPSITTQPSNINECVDGNEILIVTATGGTPSLTYQWYSNTSLSNTGGTSITGATSSSYTPASTSAGTYYYYCVVSASGNGCTTITSNAVTVTIFADPSISTQPVNITECVGGTTALSISATGGTPSLTYQWYSNTSLSNSGGTSITGATSSTYTPASTTAGAYYYYCVVSASGTGCSSATSNAVTVTIVADPSVSIQPTDITECVGGNDVLNVTATGGTPSLTYQWFSNTSLSNSGGTSLTGATSSSYTPASTSAGTYYYYCIVSASGSGCNSVTSNAVTVTIVALPSITGQPSNITECVGGNTALTVTATGGTPSLTYQWYSNTSFSNSGGTSITGATSSTYIPESTSSGTYYYYCVVDATGNGCENAISNAVSVIVVDDPIINTQPSDFIECIGGTTPLNITVIGGTPSLTYQWYSNTSLSNSGGTSITGATSSSYTPASTTAGTYYYYCIASASGNGCTSVTSNAITVYVIADQSITSQPTDINECVGGNASLSIEAVGGTPSLTYQWYSNTSLSNSGGTSINGATSSTYTPASATAGTYYYYCLVGASGNGCSTATSDAVTVTIFADPIINTQPSDITECVGGTIALSVTATGGTPSLTYQWYSNTSLSNSGGTSITGATSSTYTPASTTAGTYYYYCLINASGNGCTTAASNAVTVTVLAAPSIITQPSDIVECVGGNTAYTIVATGGTPSLTYQWYSNTSSNNTGGTSISGAASSSYIPASTVAGTYYYYCVVSSSGNGCSSIASNAVNLAVIADPSITVQPSDITECVGGTSSLSITAIGGTPELTYQWYSNASLSNSGGTSISGATSINYIPPTGTAGTYYYYCVISASGSGCTSVTSSAVTVIVIDAPSISAQLSDITECVGGNNTLNVVAIGGTPSLTYQWYSNTSLSNTGGTSIAGATTSSYTPSSATVGTYYYYCVVSSSGNGCTSVTTNAVTVTVVADPSISSQPSDITECVGGTTALSVTATGGTPSLTYQWYSNTSLSNSGGSSISGATASTYTPSSTTAGTYYYYCVIGASGNGCTSVTTNAVTVTVVADPSISVQPSDITECVDGALELSVTAIGGSPSLTYQWYSNTSLSNTGGTSIAGATSSNYAPASSSAGTYYYYCIISASGTGCTSVTTNAVTVTVVADPSISVQPSNITECVGGTTALSVTAINGTPSLTYQWYSNTSLSNSGGTSITGANSSTYTPASSTAGNYYYYCVINASGNGCNSVTTNAVTVAVIENPSITSQPVDINECVGGTTALSVTATGGTPSLTYQWYSNTSLSNAGGTSITGATSSTYTPASTFAGTYYYYCVISASGTGCTSVTSNAVTVNIIDAPAITTQPSDITECVDGNTVLSVTATGGTPSLTYQWYSNTSLSNSGGTSLTGATSSTYSPASGTAGAYYYYCVISSSGQGCNGVITNPVTVTVIADPSISVQPSDITECVGGNTSLSITATGGTPSFTYQWFSNTSLSNIGGTSITGATSSDYMPASTTEGTYYYYCVISASGNGCNTVTSNAVTVNIIADPSISAQPSDITECVGGNATLSVVATGGTPTLNYQWYSNTSLSNSGGTSISGAVSSSYTPANSTPGTYYYYCVLSASGNGCATVTTNAVTVTVIAGPSISTQPVSFNECVGGNGDLSIVATGGTPSLTYQWYSNTSLSNIGGTSISGATSTTYTPSSTTTGTYYYYCVVSASGTGCGSVTSDAVIVGIIEVPGITSQPSNISECVGGTDVLSVVATGGTPSLTYQWFSNTSLSNSGGTSISGATSSDYTPSSSTAGTYYYYCVVSASGNGCAAVTTNAVSVTINVVPEITSQPSDISECVGGASSLSIGATGGSPSLSYQWYSNTSLSNTGGTSITGATSSTYTPSSSTAGTYYYYCVISASGTGCTTVTSNAVTVTVIAAPSITSQPTDINECTGGDISLDVVATGGSPSLTYQWFSNTSLSNVGGTSITGATTPTYTPSSTTAGTYYYYCVVSSSGSGCTSVSTNPVTVTVNSDPSIITMPSSPASICVGGTTTNISLVATGATPSLIYQWQYWTGGTWENAVDGIPAGAIYSGVNTSNAFNVTQTIAGVYTYSCLVSASGNGCDAIQAGSIFVTVVEDPNINTQPSDINECVGGNEILSVVATGGTPSLTYQWYSNTSLSNTGGTSITGATSSSYSPASSTAGTYYYYCVVSASGNGCTSATSNAVTVTVFEDPNITTQPVDIAECVGGTSSLSVTAAGGTPSLTYQWFSNTSLSNSGGTSISGATSSTYLPSSAIAGTYYYYCVISASGNGCTSATSNAVTVTVLVAPSITSQPTDINECVGGDASLSIVATGGTPSLTYQWFSNTSLDNSGGTSITGATSSSYTPASTTAGAYYYYCVVSASGNGCTGTVSDAVTVNIASDPVLPTLDVATPANGSSICTGANPTATFNAGTGGVGCNDSYQYSINGTDWFAYIPGVTLITAGAGGTTVTIQGMRDCSGNGCDGPAETFTTLVSWAVTNAPADPTATKSPNVAAVCVGQILTLQDVTDNGGGAGTCNIEYRHSTDNGNNWTSWSTTPSSFAAIAGINLIEIRKSCDGSGCSYSASSQYSWTVNPTSLGGTAASDHSICAGSSPDNITLSGFVGNIQWQVSTDNVTWSDISGAISTPLTSAEMGIINTIHYYRAKVSSGVCASDYSNTITVSIQTPPTAPTGISGVITICNLSSTTLTATGGSEGSGCTYEWGTGSTIGLNIIGGATAVSYITPVLTTTTTYWVRRVGNSSCVNITDGVTETITVTPTSVGGTAASDQTICSGGVPVDITLSGNVGTIQWQVSTDNATWNDITGATSTPLTGAQMGALSVITFYRAQVTSGVCLPTYSNTITISIDAISVGGTAASDHEICAGSQPNNITLTGNIGTIQWQVSTDNNTWSNISGATATPLTSAQMGVLNSTTYYRAAITNGACAVVYSNTVIVTVKTPPVAPTSITGLTTICSGSTTTLTANGGSEGSGCTYEWGTGSTVGANIIGGATSVSYTTPALTSTTTYWVRRVGASPCNSITTGGITQTIVVDPNSVGGTAASNQTICTGNQPNNVTLSGYTGAIQWQVSTDNTTWSDISGATSTPLTSAQMGTLTATQYYRAQVTNGVCAADYSNTVIITVNATSVAGTAESNQTICLGDTPNDVTLSGNTGTIQWQVSTDNVSFVDISGATSATLTGAQIGAITELHYYRAAVNSGACSIVYSNSVSVDVQTPPTAPTDITGVTTICINNTTTLTATGGSEGSGCVYEWGTGSTVGLDIISGATNVTYTTPVLTSTTTYWVRRVGNTSCVNTTSGVSISVTVNPASVGGTAQSDQTICSGAQPADITLSGNTGLIQWQVSTDNVTWSDITGATTATLTGAEIGTLTTLTYYRAQVTNGVCPPAYSTIVTITIDAVSVAGIAASDQEICDGSQPNNITLSGNTGTIQWQVSTDNTTWEDIVGATASPLTSAQMGALNSMTYYRAAITSGTCATVYSNTVTITVKTPPTAPTSITGLTTICSGSNTLLTATGGSEGFGCTYEWGTGSTVGLNTIVGATDATYSTPSLTSSTDYWVRRIGISPCNLVTTAGVTQTILIDEISVAGTAASDHSICSGDQPNNITLSGYTGSIQWQVSSDNGFTYNDIVGATATPLTSAQMGNITEMRYYRAAVSNGVCPAANSNTVTVDIYPDNTIVLSSGSDNLETCINVPIENITYVTTGATGATFNGLPPGVVGNWTSNTVTISGTPTTVSGSPFTYTITLTGGCGNISTTGTITIIPTDVLALTSAVGTDSQTICINTSITNITYATTGATGATVIGLPAGVTANWDSDVLTISGTPTTSGTFDYTITTDGGCSTSNTGTITVQPENTITLYSAIGTDNQMLCIGQPLDNIMYYTTGATGATVDNLPAGLVANWASDYLTINGSPSENGTFTYTITLTGGCGNVSTTGVINVISNNTIILTSAINDGCIDAPIIPITYATNGSTGATYSGLPNGVDGNWASDIITLSGTPTESGTFNYTITLTGGCGNISLNDVIVINPLNDITLFSASDSISTCINEAMVDIVYNTTGATGATFAGLPPGVDGLWASNTVTISGTPTSLIGSPYNYTVTLTGGCGNITATGKINVTPTNTITLSSAPGSDTLQTPCINTAITDITYNTSGATGATFTGLPTGVSGVYSGGVITISGAPTVEGTFDFIIELTGGCSLTDTGRITVIPDNTISTPSGSLSVCVNTSVDVSYTTSGATGATVTGLPTGVSSDFSTMGNLGLVHFTGQPTEAGLFNYTITLTGGCGNIVEYGSITIIPDNIIFLTSDPGTDNQTVCHDSPITDITYATVGATGATFTNLPPGVNGDWASNTITISGTPTTSGTYDYVVTLSGGCGVVTKFGKIVVNPDNTIDLTSALNTDNQSICLNDSIIEITYATTIATGGTISGLPAGINGFWASDVYTISGAPTEIDNSPYTYTITLIGGCGTVTKTGTITVLPSNTITLTSDPGTDDQDVCRDSVMQNITYTTIGGNDASFAGLPPGVTGVYSGGDITISGTPTVSGTYDYSVTSLGGCPVTITGVIDVKFDNTITLETIGEDNQQKCIYSAINQISYVSTGGTGQITTGLPDGVTASFSNDHVYISGIPTESGLFNYTVTLTGGCGLAQISGILDIIPDNTYTLTSAPNTTKQLICIFEPMIPITYETTGATGADFSYTFQGVTLPGLPSGITGSWTNNVLTISGAPDIPQQCGEHVYHIELTGGCGVVVLSDTLRIVPQTLSSTLLTGNNEQQVCGGNSLDPIIYRTLGATGVEFLSKHGMNGAFMPGLPTGVTGVWTYQYDTTLTEDYNGISYNIDVPLGYLTISGSTTNDTTFYSFELTGGCGNIDESGTIIYGDFCCLNSDPWGNVTMPDNNTEITITTIQWAGDYAAITITETGSYRFTSSNPLDFLTLRRDTYDGMCVQKGLTPITYNCTAGTTYYLHTNLGCECGIESVNRTTTAKCTSCPPPPNCSVVQDLGGDSLIITSNVTLFGTYINVGLFQVDPGVVLTVSPTCKFLNVSATKANVYGTINANGSGESGGEGGKFGGFLADEVFWDGRGTVWCWDKDNSRPLKTLGGTAGNAGGGLGAGITGGGGSFGSGYKQECDFIGDDVGRVCGSGGGGSGAGGSYGGAGAIGNYGGAGGSEHGGYNAGSGGFGGVNGNVYGSSTDGSISFGSGGSGGGGGGRGAGSGYSNGNNGGNGGGAVSIFAGDISVTGSILANGLGGGTGGAGGSTYQTARCCSDWCSGDDERTYSGSGGGGGGAGGGSGGGILLKSTCNMNVTGTLQANGGSGGSGGGRGGSGSSGGSGGGGGGGGRIKLFYVANPCAVNVVPGSIVPSGGGGGAAGYGASGSAGAGLSGAGGSYYTEYSTTLPVTPGSIGIDKTICNGMSAAPLVSVEDATEGVCGNIAYQWMKCTSGGCVPPTGFSNTSAADVYKNYNDTSAHLTTTTYFVRRATSGTCVTYSNVITVYVDPLPPNTITMNSGSDSTQTI